MVCKINWAKVLQCSKLMYFFTSECAQRQTPCAQRPWRLGTFVQVSGKRCPWRPISAQERGWIHPWTFVERKRHNAAVEQRHKASCSFLAVYRDWGSNFHTKKNFCV